MTTTQRSASSRHSDYLDVAQDEDRTMFDYSPWHQEEETTGVRSVPRVAARPAPRPAPLPPSSRRAAPAFRVVPPVTPTPAPAPRPAPAPVHALARRSSQARVSEVVESLSLPPGMREDMLPVGARPHGEHQVRIAIVRVARELGRDYRVHRGCILRTDAAAVETFQRHLLGFASEVLAGRMDSRALAPEVARHGALFGEIIARRFDAEWVDVSGDQPGLWQMSARRGGTFSPIARVHRFLLQRNREQDLVGFFLDLDAAHRSRG